MENIFKTPEELRIKARRAEKRECYRRFKESIERIQFMLNEAAENGCNTIRLYELDEKIINTFTSRGFKVDKVPQFKDLELSIFSATMLSITFKKSDESEKLWLGKIKL